MMPERDDVQRYWTTNALSFDTLYASQKPWERAFNAVFRRALFERIRLAADEVRKVSNATVLDVGCGSGRTAIPLAKAGAGRVVGVDFAPTMIEIANRSAQDAGVADRCEFRVADFMAESFSEDKFDIVSALGVFDYVDASVSFLKRMLELSRGIAIFSVPEPSLLRANLRKIRYGRHGVKVHFYTERAVRDLCADAGGKNVVVHRIPAGFVAVCSV
jgi:2-polyprenyl-3-methyl-5-hydroxy-6-metoxy-1,4-benzoquinol methylase